MEPIIPITMEHILADCVKFILFNFQSWKSCTLDLIWIRFLVSVKASVILFGLNQPDFEIFLDFNSTCNGPLYTIGSHSLYSFFADLYLGPKALKVKKNIFEYLKCHFKSKSNFYSDGTSNQINADPDLRLCLLVHLWITVDMLHDN